MSSTILETELRQQADAIADRGTEGAAAAAAAAELLGRPDVQHLVIAARGTSDNAARFAQYLLGVEARLVVGLAAPWLYRDTAAAPRLDGAAVIGISQSGRSPDIVGVLAAARAQGRPAIAITNDAGSALAAEADVVVPLLAGAERSVAATKTYLTTLHAIVQVLEALRPDAARREWLGRLPGLVHDAVDTALRERARFDPLAGARMITVTGRGLSFAAACESALKMRELSGVPAEAYSPPDLMHGPIAAVTSSAAAWVISRGAQDEERDALAGLLERTGAGVVVGADERLLAAASIPVALPADVPDWVASILAVPPAQTAGLRLAERSGVDVDSPHGLSKVTLTR